MACPWQIWSKVVQNLELDEEMQEEGSSRATNAPLVSGPAPQRTFDAGADTHTHANLQEFSVSVVGMLTT